jgi:hypothetical protein
MGGINGLVGQGRHIMQHPTFPPNPVRNRTRQGMTAPCFRKPTQQRVVVGVHKKNPWRNILAGQIPDGLPKNAGGETGPDIDSHGDFRQGLPPIPVKTNQRRQKRKG